MLRFARSAVELRIELLPPVLSLDNQTRSATSHGAYSSCHGADRLNLDVGHAVSAEDVPNYERVVRREDGPRPSSSKGEYEHGPRQHAAEYPSPDVLVA